MSRFSSTVVVVVIVVVAKSNAFTGLESTYVVNDAGILGNIGDEAIHSEAAPTG